MGTVSEEENQENRKLQKEVLDTISSLTLSRKASDHKKIDFQLLESGRIHY
jgi:hypothetical protein